MSLTNKIIITSNLTSFIKKPEIDALHEECLNRGIQFEEVTIASAHLFNRNQTPMAVMNSSMINENHYRFLREMELRGSKVLNNVAAIRIAEDKFLSNLELKYAGFPVPKTIELNTWGFDFKDGAIPDNVARQALKTGQFATGYGIKDHIIKEFTFPLLIKHPHFAMGIGIILVESETHFRDIFDLLYATNPRIASDGESCSNLIVQEFIKETIGKDIRLLVIDYEVVGGVYREHTTGWKANDHRLADRIRERFEVPHDLKMSVEKAARHMKLRYAGFDILFGKNGFIFGEINCGPQFTNFIDLHPEIDIPKKIIDALLT